MDSSPSETVRENSRPSLHSRLYARITIYGQVDLDTPAFCCFRDLTLVYTALLTNSWCSPYCYITVHYNTDTDSRPSLCSRIYARITIYGQVDLDTLALCCFRDLTLVYTALLNNSRCSPYHSRPSLHSRLYARITIYGQVDLDTLALCCFRDLTLVYTALLNNSWCSPYCYITVHCNTDTDSRPSLHSRLYARITIYGQVDLDTLALCCFPGVHHTGHCNTDTDSRPSLHSRLYARITIYGQVDLDTLALCCFRDLTLVYTALLTNSWCSPYCSITVHCNTDTDSRPSLHSRLYARITIYGQVDLDTLALCCFRDLTLVYTALLNNSWCSPYCYITVHCNTDTDSRPSLHSRLYARITIYGQVDLDTLALCCFPGVHHTGHCNTDTDSRPSLHSRLYARITIYGQVDLDTLALCCFRDLTLVYTALLNNSWCSPYCYITVHCNTDTDSRPSLHSRLYARITIYGQVDLDTLALCCFRDLTLVYTALLNNSWCSPYCYITVHCNTDTDSRPSLHSRLYARITIYGQVDLDTLALCCFRDLTLVYTALLNNSWCSPYHSRPSLHSRLYARITIYGQVDLDTLALCCFRDLTLVYTALLNNSWCSPYCYITTLRTYHDIWPSRFGYPGFMLFCDLTLVYSALLTNSWCSPYCYITVHYNTDTDSRPSLCSRIYARITIYGQVDLDTLALCCFRDLTLVYSALLNNSWCSPYCYITVHCNTDTDSRPSLHSRLYARITIYGQVDLDTLALCCFPGVHHTGHCNTDTDSRPSLHSRLYARITIYGQVDLDTLALCCFRDLTLVYTALLNNSWCSPYCSITVHCNTDTDSRPSLHSRLYARITIYGQVDLDTLALCCFRDLTLVYTALLNNSWCSPYCYITVHCNTDTDSRPSLHSRLYARITIYGQVDLDTLALCCFRDLTLVYTALLNNSWCSPYCSITVHCNTDTDSRPSLHSRLYARITIYGQVDLDTLALCCFRDLTLVYTALLNNSWCSPYCSITVYCNTDTADRHYTLDSTHVSRYMAKSIWIPWLYVVFVI
ncbi:hypothetical protein J6590_069465 [Homalodisca vitripennis]|nr:hypothetical protein J6590_069465 [Homalodisca vitripennis]